MTVMVSTKGEREGAMISENVKVSALDEMPEVLDCKIHCQKLPIEGTVPGLCRL